jgi:hypothetical protein
VIGCFLEPRWQAGLLLCRHVGLSPYKLGPLLGGFLRDLLGDASLIALASCRQRFHKN